MAEEKTPLPGWVKAWLVSTAVIQTWDASFIWLRPHTFPGGALELYWKPYSLYIDIDMRYKDMTDSFVMAVSLLNYVEVVLCLVLLYMNAKSSSRTVLATLVVQTMTFWKTVLYLLMYVPPMSDVAMLGTSNWLELLFLFIIPNGLWVLIPGATMWEMWGRAARQGGAQTTRGKKGK
ncbi:emopamil-binding protein-like [Branchiostoma floridae]|uniref:Emopamil-binding protein-like n=1 Tax=Branchiostoma floridae TaxID=7739 RepID=A0A9J7MWH4_BRAFL|nr:emopamil-binding protein-like [Branchiostoma floridae]